jgi:hypothetical protein
MKREKIKFLQLSCCGVQNEIIKKNMSVMNKNERKIICP